MQITENNNLLGLANAVRGKDIYRGKGVVRIRLQ